jgi:hypothetical protein
MSVTVKYMYVPVDETQSVVNFDDWAKTLSAGEQEAVEVAGKKFTAKLRLLEHQGKLQVTYAPEMTCVWTTSADADSGLPVVAEWEAIQTRYCSASNAKVTTVRT